MRQVQRQRGLRVQHTRQRGVRGGQLGQQLRADGEQIAPSQRGDLADVAKTGPHHLGLDAKLFVVIEDLRDRPHAGVVRARVVGFDPGGTGRFFVPVVNAPDKRRDQLHLGLGARHRLAKREQQCQVGMNTTLLQLGGSLDALPGGCHLDEHPVNVNALPLVQLNQAFGTGHAGAGIEAQTRIDFCGNPPRNDGQDLAAKTHQQAVSDFIQGAAPELLDRFLQQRAVLGLLHRFQDQRRVGGGIRRLKHFNLLEIASVSHHGGELFEGIELVHADIIQLRRASPIQTGYSAWRSMVHSGRNDPVLNTGWEKSNGGYGGGSAGEPAFYKIMTCSPYLIRVSSSLINSIKSPLPPTRRGRPASVRPRCPATAHRRGRVRPQKSGPARCQRCTQKSCPGKPACAK